MPKRVKVLKATKPGTRASEELALAQPLALSAGDLKVDRAAGVIRGVSLMTMGTAKGHGFEVDHETLTTLVKAYKANPNVKVRLTHAERQGKDGAERLVGRVKDVRVEGDRVRGDIHFGSFAKTSPMGNLWDYLFDIAESDPSIIGMSCVAKFDFETVVDPKTEEETFFARCAFLRAVDFVDDPAANRQGMLSTPPITGTPEKDAMNARQRALLVKLGMKKDATVKEAKAFALALGEAEKTQYTALAAAPEGDGDGDGASDGDEAMDGASDGDETDLSAGDDEDEDPAPAPKKKKPKAPKGDVALSAQQQAQARADERGRIAGLQGLAKKFSLGEEWLSGHIEDETTLADARIDALEHLAAERQPVGAPRRPRVSGGDDGRETVMAGLTDAIALQAGLKIEKPHARAAEFQFLSMREQFNCFLGAMGVDTRKLTPRQTWDAVTGGFEAMHRLGVGEVALSMNSSDFPVLLANVQNKILLDGYDNEPSTHEAWCAEMEIKDFKPARLMVSGKAPVPPKVLEGAEYTLANIGEKYESVTLAKYGQLVCLTWEAFINDDQGAFTGDTLDHGGACRELENDLAYAIITANPTMTEDSVALFHSTHTNLNAVSQGAPTLARISGMRSAMRKQKGVPSESGLTDGRRIALRPEVVLVPEVLADSVMQLFSATVDVAATNHNTPNYPFVRQLKVVSDPRLDENSTAKWYACAGKRSRPAVLAFLRGHRRPFITRENAQINTDGLVYKVRHVVGAAAGEWRAWQANDG